MQRLTEWRCSLWTVVNLRPLKLLSYINNSFDLVLFVSSQHSWGKCELRSERARFDLQGGVWCPTVWLYPVLIVELQLNCRSNRNLFGCIDWTTGLLLNYTTAEGYQQQQQGTQAGISSVSNSNHSSTYLTPSYTAPQISSHNSTTRAGTSFQDLSPGPSSLVDTSPGEVYYTSNPPELNATQRSLYEPETSEPSRNSIRSVSSRTSMPGPSHIPRGVRSDSFAMNKGKVRVAKKRGTSVMSWVASTTFIFNHSNTTISIFIKLII